MFTSPTNDRLLRFNVRDEWNVCDSSSLSSSTVSRHGDFLPVFSSDFASSAGSSANATQLCTPLEADHVRHV